MTARFSLALRLAPVLASAVFVWLAQAPAAQAQSMLGSDPYRPYYGGYEVSSLPPSAMNNFSAADAARARSYSARANQMAQFYDELYGPAPGLQSPVDGARRTPLPGVSYTQGDRAYDRQFGRVYTPNTTMDGRNLDAEFYKDQQRRARDYAAALQEKDPKKRAEKLRAVQLDNQRAARAMAPSPRTAPANRARTRTPAATGTGAATGAAVAPAPAPATGTRTPTTATPATGAARPRPRVPLGATAPPMAPAGGASRFGTTAPPPPTGTTVPPAATPRAASPGGARSSTSRSLVPLVPLTTPSGSASRPARARAETPSEVIDRALRMPDPATDSGEQPESGTGLPSRTGRPAGTGTTPFRAGLPR